MPITTEKALELLKNGERLECIKGPLLGHCIQKTGPITGPDGTRETIIRSGNTIVSLGDFILCEWQHIATCEHCNGKGWIKSEEQS